MTDNIAGVIVLYNPDITKTINNISSYINEVKKLYVIDNSKEDHSAFFLYDHKLIYISNKQNLGISKALNIGCQLSFEKEFEWVLTMDQDSSFKEGDLKKMIQLIYSAEKNTFIISPEYIASKQNNSAPSIEYVKWAITSGQLMNLSFYKELGAFNEDYFIDQVDFEYCLRGRKKGLKIMKANFIRLEHNLGNPKKVKITILGKEITVSNHNAVRKYYFVRNFLYLKKEYIKDFPELFKEETYMFFKIIIKTMLFEEDKKNKIKKMVKGYKDFRKGIKGEYKDK